MGKNIMIYFRDGVSELIESIDDRGKLLNQLVLDYFNNDEDHLRFKIDKVTTQLNGLKAQLNNKINEREAKQAMGKVQRERTAEERAERTKQENEKNKETAIRRVALDNFIVRTRLDLKKPKWIPAKEDKDKYLNGELELHQLL